MAPDRLSVLQAETHQLYIQYFSAISYLTQRHPLQYPKEVPGLPFTKPHRLNLGKKENPVPGPEDADKTSVPYPLQIEEDQKKFEEAQEELAEDLILKTQQIQSLIAGLPGIDQDEHQQAEDIKRLIEELEEVEKQKAAKRREMHTYVKRLDAVVAGMGRSIGHPSANGHTNDG